MTDSRTKKASSGELFAELKKHPWVLAVVILFHVGLAIMLSINLASDDKPPVPSAKKHDIIDAVVVDAKLYDDRKKQKELERKKAIEKKKLDEAQAVKDKAAKIRQKELERKKAVVKKKAAEKKAAILKQQKEIQIAKKKAVEKKKAEEKKIKEEKIRKDKAKKDKAKKEKQRLEAEKKQKAEEKRKRIEAEKKRKAEEERKRRAEEKADFERELLEEERREEEARKAAARAVRLQTQREQYIMQIKQKVENNWLRPAANIDGQSCDVIVTQTMQGSVIDVRMQSCTENTAFQRSVERAVRKAEPLPLPPSPDVYAREIQFTFKPR